MGHPITVYTDEVKQEIKKKFEEYINNTDIPIIAEFAYINDIPRSSLYDIEELATLLKKAISKKESQLERQALKNDINVTMAIFSLKQIGWKDTHDITGNMNLFSSTISKFFEK